MQVSHINRSRKLAIDVCVIYTLACPLDGAVRYIGKTDVALSLRLKRHLREPNNEAKRAWITRLAHRGLQPIIAPLFLVPDGMRWQDAERFFIASALYLGLPLTNATRGGNGLNLIDDAARAAVIENFRAAWKRSDVRAKRLAGIARANADPRVIALRAQGRTAAKPKQSAALKEWQNRPDVKARTAEHWREFWSVPEHQARKRANTKAAWDSATPEERAQRRARMSQGKRLGWARKKMEVLRREMEWDTA